MMIRISYYPDANDEVDAKAMDPQFNYYDESISDAHDTLMMVSRLIDLERKQNGTENAGADTLQPDVEEDI